MHEICRTTERMLFPQPCLRVKQGLHSFLLLTAWGWHDYGQNSGQYVQHIDQRACLLERKKERKIKKEVESCTWIHMKLRVGRYETVCILQLLAEMIVPLSGSHGMSSASIRSS